jgi:flagellar biosynthesis/type III secretory pathway ATPase
VDAAIDHWPRIVDFLRQDMLQPTSFAHSLEQLRSMMAAAPAGKAAA